MNALPTSYQNLAADLISKTHDDALSLRGSIYRQAKRGITNVYVKMPLGSTRKSVFIGPDGKPETQTKIEATEAASLRAKGRRKDLSVLEGLGLLLSPAFSGQVVDAIAYHGLFRNGGVLIGTLAYQCYPLTLGWILPSTILATDDADLAAANVALSADDGLDMQTILKDADPSFEALPGLDHRAPPARFRSASGYVVDLLTPTRQRDEKQPIPLEGLQAGAISLQYLAWLIEDAIPGALPFGSGVAVTIPRPERFAVHKLILSQKRTHDQNKVQKDLAQAKALVEAVEATRPGRIGDEVEDAISQGKRGWRDPILTAVKTIWARGEWQDMEAFDVLTA